MTIFSPHLNVLSEKVNICSDTKQISTKLTPFTSYTQLVQFKVHFKFSIRNYIPTLLRNVCIYSLESGPRTRLVKSLDSRPENPGGGTMTVVYSLQTAFSNFSKKHSRRRIEKREKLVLEYDIFVIFYFLNFREK